MLYSSFDHHLMLPPHYTWDERDVPEEDQYKANGAGWLIPMFCVNETLGEFINDTRDDSPPTKIDGDIHQSFYAGYDNYPGVDAYNAIGELNIDESPNDEYIIITNRYDGMWGATPGDSGIGTAMVLALARHQKDLQQNYSIDPKYNITYLFTTGEEMGFRGAYYHRDNLSEEDKDNIKMWIGFDQLGMDQSDLVSAPDLRSPNDGENAYINRDVIWAIANTTNYEDRSGYDFEPSVQTGSGASEDGVWGDGVCDTIVFKKDNARAWDRWHTTGNDYDDGDSLKYTDKNDVNLTYDLAWLFVKYKCYDPDSWFTNVSYETIDSTNDGDSLPDSIKANFTINTIMPHDQAMVRAFLKDVLHHKTAATTKANYTVTSTGVEQSITVTLPDDKDAGNYYLHLALYNSTGRINYIVGIPGYNINDTDTSSSWYLDPPPPNVPPDLPSNPTPTDGATNVSVNPTLSAYVSDPHDDLATVSIYEAVPPGNVILDTESQWNNGTYTNTTTDGNGTLELLNETLDFGDGSDGDHTVGTYETLTSDKNYSNLTVLSGKVLVTAGYIVRVSGTLINEGLIKDTVSGGSGGSGGNKGHGINPHYSPTSGGYGGNGGSGGDGGHGGAGGGGAWDPFWEEESVGGDGGAGGSGGHGGGYVEIYAFNLNNLGVIHANGTDGENGENGADGEYDWYWAGIVRRDAAGGGGGGGEGGDGGDGGTVEIYYANLLDDGDIYANGGNGGGGGGAGNSPCDDLEYNAGVFQKWEDGASGISGGGCGGESDIGTICGPNVAEPGTPGSPGLNGEIIISSVKYVLSGTYSQSYDAGETVNWTDVRINMTTPSGTDAEVSYGENSTETWIYHDDIDDVPDSRWLKIQVNLSTTNNSLTPTIDSINISYHKQLLHVASDVSNGSYVDYTWNGLSQNTTYYWRVFVSDGLDVTHGLVWNFSTVEEDPGYPPEITNVSNNPDIVGFGFNVTVSADVTDNGSGVDVVKINIIYPGSSTENYTMENTAGDTYEYVFNDAWLVGQYNYTIWTRDNAGNSNSSSGHSFNVSANATISVCTVKDTYGAGEDINITDPPNEDEPYLYWDAPENSFGIRSMKTVNWSYFWELFRQHSDWQLEAWHPINEEWVDEWQGTDLNEWLDISKIRSDDNSSEKITLNVTNNHPTEALKFRFKFGIDLRVKEYVNKSSNYEYELTYPANDAENYTVFFNFSDIKPLIQNGTVTASHGIKEYQGNDIFWFMITANQTLGAGNSFEIDPTFGNTKAGKSTMTIENKVVGNKFQMGATSGTADNITAYLYLASGLATVYYRFLLYDSSKNLVGETNEGSLSGSYGTNWHTLTFADPPTLTADAYYYICAWANSGLVCDADLYYEPGASTIYYDLETYNGAPDPFAANVEVFGGTSSIYCTYTENSAPEISNPYPSDGSTNISVNPTLNITVADDGDTMTITWYSNSSGSWVEFGSNSSVDNGTYHQVFSNASVNGQWWYWDVSVDDGIYTVWSDVYKFYTGVQSKIVNTGSTNISGYLLMQVEFYSDVQTKWVLDNETINETTPRTINAGEQLALDLIFNGLVTTDDLTNGDGTYRVYAAFRDPDGDVLVTDDARKLEAWWEFEVDTS